MIYTVSEDVEIVLNGTKYILEAGDQIVLEAISLLEPELKDIAEKLSDRAKQELLSLSDLRRIKEDNYGDVENYGVFKNLVKQEFKDRGIKYRVTDGLMGTFFAFLIDYVESGGLTPENPTRDPALKQFDGWRD